MDLHEVYGNLDNIKKLDDVARVWDRDYSTHISPWYCRGYKLSDWELLDGLPLQDMTALNIGASYPIDAICIGWKFKEFHETDFTPAIVDKMKQTFVNTYPNCFHDKIFFDVVDATDIKVPPNTYDIVIAYSSLDHIPEHNKAIDEMCRVAKRYVCITLPNVLDEFNAEYSRQHPERFGYERYWHPKEIIQKMTDRDFIPIKYNNNENRIKGNRFGYLFEKI